MASEQTACYKNGYILFEVEVNDDGQSVCLGVRLPSVAHDQIFVSFLTIVGFFL
jgi:hypothetical protein